MVLCQDAIYLQKKHVIVTEFFKVVQHKWFLPREIQLSTSFCRGLCRMFQIQRLVSFCRIYVLRIRILTILLPVRSDALLGLEVTFRYIGSWKIQSSRLLVCWCFGVSRIQGCYLSQISPSKIIYKQHYTMLGCSQRMPLPDFLAIMGQNSCR